MAKTYTDAAVVNAFNAWLVDAPAGWTFDDVRAGVPALTDASAGVIHQCALDAGVDVHPARVTDNAQARAEFESKRAAELARAAE